jgi:hypothetical protein
LSKQNDRIGKSNNVTARRSKIMHRFNPSFNSEKTVGNYVKKKNLTSPTGWHNINELSSALFHGY